MLLTVLIFLPILAGLAVLFLREEQGKWIRHLSLGASLATALLGVLVTLIFLSQPAPTTRQVSWELTGSTLANRDPSAGLLRQKIDWFSPAGIAAGHPKPRGSLDFSYHVGVDGLSIWLVMLTAFLAPIVVASSFTAITRNLRRYYSLILILLGAVLGVFCARDLLLFYIFFEFTLVPLFVLVGNYGSANRRKAAVLLFLYTFAGSVMTFAGILYLAYCAMIWKGAGGGVFSFDLQTLQNMLLSGFLTTQEKWWLFAAMFIGFAIKVPLFPFHTWLPLAHTEAPTAGSVILASLLLKLGTYGFLRFCLPFFPSATMAWAPVLAVMFIIGILYPAWVAWVQPDIKRLVAYSSVSHLGLCMIGMFSLTPAGLTGSVLYMINHGLSTGALFLLVGMFYERFHTRQFVDLGGLARVMPVFAFFLVFFTLTSIGLPGTNGFVSEFLVLFGTFVSNTTTGTGEVAFRGPLGPWFAIPAALGVVFGAVYMLDMVRKLAYGPVKYPGYVPPAGEGESGTGKKETAPQAADYDAPPAPGSGMGLEAHHEPPSGRLDLNPREISILVPLAVACLIIGLYPRFMTNSIEAAARLTVKTVAYATEPPDRPKDYLEKIPPKKAVPQPASNLDAQEGGPRL